MRQKSALPRAASPGDLDQGIPVSGTWTHLISALRASCGRLTAVTDRRSVAWAADTWRVPAWLWIGVAAMASGLLHILLDMGVGLFDMDGRLSVGVASVLIVIVLIHIWWVLSFVAGAQGRGGGILSAAVLALGWTTMMNGYPIVFCPPTCVPGSPLSDIAHIGSLVLGPLAALAATWALWRGRPKLGWVLPVGAVLLVIAMLAAFSSTPID